MSSSYYTTPNFAAIAALAASNHQWADVRRMGEAAMVAAVGKKIKRVAIIAVRNADEILMHRRTKFAEDGKSQVVVLSLVMGRVNHSVDACVSAAARRVMDSQLGVTYSQGNVYHYTAAARRFAASFPDTALFRAEDFEPAVTDDSGDPYVGIRSRYMWIRIGDLAMLAAKFSANKYPSLAEIQFTPELLWFADIAYRKLGLPPADHAFVAAATAAIITFVPMKKQQLLPAKQQEPAKQQQEPVKQLEQVPVKVMFASNFDPIAPIDRPRRNPIARPRLAELKLELN